MASENEINSESQSLLIQQQEKLKEITKHFLDIHITDENEDELCQVCYTNIYNRKNHKIECPNCNYHCCLDCQKKHFQSAQLISCMNCNHSYDDMFLDQTFTKAYILGELKQKREQLLYEQHVARLQNPDLLRRAQIYKQVQDYINEINTTHKYIDNLIEQHKKDLITETDYQEQSLVYTKKLINLIENHQQFQQQYRLYENRTNAQTDTEQNETKQRSKIQRSCPMNDCKGFLNEYEVCQLCCAWICSDCNEFKMYLKTPTEKPFVLSEKDKQNATPEQIQKEQEYKNEHICKQENIDSFQLIKRDSKNCPQCRAFIYRIEGCYQMWCTNCNIGFCWKTGNVINNDRMHNPHFFNWLSNQTRDQQNVRDLRDVPCGGLLRPIELRRLMNKIHENTNGQFNREKQDKFMEINRSMLHIQDVERARYPIIVQREKYEHLYLDYLVNKITQTQFKQKLFAMEKRIRKNVDIRQIFDLVNTVGAEQLNYLVTKQNSTDCEDVLNTFEEYFKTIEQLRVYFNKEMDEILRRYDSAMMIIIVEPFQVERF